MYSSHLGGDLASFKLIDMSFVKLENLNDFIQPQASCTKPVPKSSGKVGRVNEVNLSDCLACSGCITSSESVLIQQQNSEEFFKVINDSKSSKTPREIVISLSLQSVASLAASNSISDPQVAAEKLASFFVSIGCDKIFDINIARHLALVETHREYTERRTNDVSGPIFSSVCPGWICYVEKTNGDLVIPKLSKVRSPQQIMGALIKKRRESNQSVYHVTVMPCFDKKLEASRKDFMNELDNTKDVDCVLTPVEIEEILRSEGANLSEFERRPLDTLVDDEIMVPLKSHIGNESGGYAENLLANEICSALKCDLQDVLDNIDYVYGKNNDFIELSLKNSLGLSDSQIPKIAIINGFRNIQTIIQRLKRKMISYDYIEVMACPSGCINGGAQSKVSSSNDQQAWIQKAKDVYRKVAPVSLSTSSLSDENSLLYHKLNIDDQALRDQLFYTDFHSVPKTTTLNVSW